MFKLLVCLFVLSLTFEQSLGIFSRCGLGEVYKSGCPKYCENTCKYGQYKNAPECVEAGKPCGKQCQCAFGFIRDPDTGSCLTLASCWWKKATYPVPPTI